MPMNNSNKMDSDKEAHPDFFISYSIEDEAWAEWIAWILDDAGYSTFLQAWDFKAGGNFVNLMDTASKAKTTIAVLSQRYTQSPFCSSEWYAAFAKDPTGVNRKLIPIRVEEFQPTGLMAQVIYVDFVGRSE